MIKKFIELTEEQRMAVGKALLGAIVKDGRVEFGESILLDDDVEVYRMGDIEASDCVFEYLESEGSSLDDWQSENDVELYWFNSNCGCICTREAMNEYLEDEYEDMVDFAERKNVISNFF
jgi:hypothetical protein